MPADTPNDHDVLANQLALHNAQQSNAAKALAAQFGDSDGEDSAGDSDSSTRDRAREEQLNVRTSELTGIGYQAPADPDFDGDAASLRQESAATERLRRQLLGKHARAPRGALTTGGAMMPGGGQKFAASKAMSKPPPKRDASEDEDEGRSSISKSRRKQIGCTPTRDDAARADADVVERGATVTPAAATKKRGSSYLDEVLAKRGAKKKRKANAKGNNE